MIWLVLLLLTGGALVLLLRPFFHEGAAAIDASASATAIFKDQLAEIDKELAAGSIDAAQADGAKLDVKRRLLQRLPDAEPPGRRLAVIERKFIGGLVAASVGLGSLILYANVGNPGLPSVRGQGQPFAGHPPVAPGQVASAPASTANSSAFGQAAPASAVGSVDEMIERLAERLKQNPSDANGWRMLGWSYAGVGRFADAAAAYEKAIALQPRIGTLHTSRGDALVRGADGKVTPEALAAFETALKLDADDAAARNGVGLAKLQAGDKRGAVEAWIVALSKAGPNDAWADETDKQARILAGELGINISSVPVRSAFAAPSAQPSGGILGRLQASSPPGGVSPPTERGPSAEDVKAAEALSAKDRQAMIVGMVDGLQQRLDASPRDADGWVRLIKSRKVMGETEKAKAALARALAVFADSVGERAKIEAAAREAGVTP